MRPGPRRNPIWLAAAALLLAASCGGPPPEGRPEGPPLRTPILESRPVPSGRGTLLIASIFPTLGRYAISGEESHRGVALAAEEARREGPIHGRGIEILTYRTGSDPTDVESAARDAASSGALALIGCNASVLSQTLASVAQTRGISMVSNVSTVTDLTWDPVRNRNREYVFRVCHSDDRMARFLADFARGDLGGRRAAVLYDESRSYSRSLADGFCEGFAAGEGGTRGGDIRRYYYAAYETDFRAQLLAIRKFDPDVLFVPGSFIDASLIAVQASDLGLRATLLGGDSWSNRLLFSRGGPKGPCYHGDHWFVGGPFLETYRERYGEDPNGGRAALAHDALGVVVAALANLGPLADGELDPEGERIERTRDRLRRQIALVEYDGVTGPISFDEHGDPPQKGVIVKIADGERTLVKRLER